MDADELENILENLVRVGTVTDVDGAGQRVRVKFRDTGLTSDWLRVLQRTGEGLDIAPDGEHTHKIIDTWTGGGQASTQPSHSHPGSTVTAWMPKVNSEVLCLYLPVFSGDGFVLGGL